MSLSLPERPFPPYSYVPGRFPHPLSDPAGHSFGFVPEPCNPLTTENALQHEEYQWGIQLFNHGYYWEAHENWEQVWHACGRKGEAANYLKGLIKLAAAGVKTREGRPDGVARHAIRALELFGSLQGSFSAENEKMPYGISLNQLAKTAQDIAAHPDERIDTRDSPVVVTLPML